MVGFAFCFCSAENGRQGLTHGKQMLYHCPISPDPFSLFVLSQDPTELSKSAMNLLWSPDRPCICILPVSVSWVSGITGLYHKASVQTYLHLCLPTSRAHPLTTMESHPPLAFPVLCKPIIVMWYPSYISAQWYWAYLWVPFMLHIVIYLFMDFFLL